MDTETFAKRLFEFQTLLDRLQQEIELPQPKKEAALNEIFQHILWVFQADEVSTEPMSETQEHQLLSWLLKTEQRLLEESHQQIMLLQSIIQNSPAGLAVVSGPELSFRVATATYQAMLPYPKIDLIGRSYAEVWPPADGFDGEKLIRQMFAGGANLQFDRLEQRYPDGLLHSFSFRICRLPWQGELGALILMQETTQADQAHYAVVDIAEESHRQAEELDALIMAMAEALTIFDKNGVVTRANPAAIDLFNIDPVGIDRHELIELLSMRHPDGSPIELRELPSERALRGEIITGQRLLLINSEGDERVVRVSASPLFNDVGVSAVVTVWHDVTERERLLEQLEIEQARLETIIKNAPEAIIVADEEGRFVLGNPAAEHILGRPLPYGKEVDQHSELQICYSDGTPYIPRNLPLTCSAIDGESLINIELLVILPEGQARHLLSSSAPIVDRKGNLNGAVGVLQDITERKQAEEALRRQASRSQLLVSLSQAFAEAGLNYLELLDTIVQQVGGVFGDICSLELLSKDGEWYSPAAIYLADSEQLKSLQQITHDMRIPSQEGLMGQILQTGHSLVLTDITRNEIRSLLPNLYLPITDRILPDYVNVLVVPLRAHGRWIGTLNLIRLLKGSHYTPEDQAFLQDLADRAALAIEDSRLYEREAQRARELQALHQATTALLSTIDLETLLAQILDAAQQAFPAAEQGALYLLSQENQADEDHLEIRAAFGCEENVVLVSQLKQNAARSAQEKRPLLLNEINIDPIPSAETNKDSSSETGSPAVTGSAIIAPLMLPQRVLGALALFGPKQKLFTENDLHLLDSFAATATAALQNATLYAEVERLATTDTVTEQLNRRKFFELGELEMHRFHRFRSPLSAIMLDLDNFKEVNDSYGHGAGDAVLRVVAQRCRSSIRMIDILGRYGGDEFGILLPSADLEKACEIAERIRHIVTSTPIKTDQGEIIISVSLGVAQANQEMEHLSILLGRADAALYEAKQTGRNRVMRGL